MAVAISIASCGNSSENSAAQNAGDSGNANISTPAPMGDSSTQINSNAGMHPADTSNQNGNDSVKGTSRMSRSTTPGNDSGNAGRKQ